MDLGYKYGVWLYVDDEEIGTEHISHITIACFMEKEDAIRLCRELIQEVGETIYIEINKKGCIFDDNTSYIDDKNDIFGWGYYGKSKMWKKIEEISKKYSCNFSFSPHLSMEYRKNRQELKPYDLICNKKVKGIIKAVNINGSDPKLWHIIEV